MKKPKNKAAKSLQEKNKKKHRLEVAAWRKAHPRKSKEIYKRHYLKKKGTDFKPKHKGAYYGAFKKTSNPKQANPNSVADK